MKMKRNSTLLGIIAVAAIIAVLSGCATTVKIKGSEGMSSVIKGGTLQLRSGGKSLVWSVSSTPAEGGRVASGTSISDRGVLTVAADESASNLYIFCKSQEDGLTDTMQVRVVSVTGIEITNKPEDLLVPDGGGFINFTARVSGENNPDQNVLWTVHPQGFFLGSVLTVGKGVLVGTTLTITAKSTVDPTKYATTTVRVYAPTDPDLIGTWTNESSIGDTIYSNYYTFSEGSVEVGVNGTPIGRFAINNTSNGRMSLRVTHLYTDFGGVIKWRDKDEYKADSLAAAQAEGKTVETSAIESLFNNSQTWKYSVSGKSLTITNTDTNHDTVYTKK